MADLRLSPRVGEDGCARIGEKKCENYRGTTAETREASVRYDAIATDSWNSFEKVFSGTKHLARKQYTKGIGGNNCRFHSANGNKTLVIYRLVNNTTPLKKIS